MSTPLLFFYLLSVFTVLGSLGVVFDRNVVRAALMLLVALLGTAGLFLVTFAEFLALTQILIYGGAVTIVVLFAIMLTRSSEVRIKLDNPQRPWAGLASVATFGLLTATFVIGDVGEVGSARGLAQGSASEGAAAGGSDFEMIGDVLFSAWAIPFEVASLVLLVAMIGAIVLARAGDSSGASQMLGGDQGARGEDEH